MGMLGKGLKPDGSGCREDGGGGGLAGIDAELDEGRFEDVAPVKLAMQGTVTSTLL